MRTAKLLASLLLVAGFLSHYWQDRRLAGMAELPAWYLPLRSRLTVMVMMPAITGHGVHAGTFYGGLFRSADNGLTWSYVPSPASGLPTSNRALARSSSKTPSPPMSPAASSSPTCGSG